MRGLVTTLSYGQERAGFGQALALSEGILAVGAPFVSWQGCFQCGAVFLYNSSSWEKINTFLGEMPGGQFGQSLALLDLNGDGQMDLAVSAPGEVTGGQSYGAVHLYFGRFQGGRSDLRLYSQHAGVFGTRLHPLEEHGLGIGSPWLSPNPLTPQAGVLHALRSPPKPLRPAQAPIDHFSAWNVTVPEPANAHGYDWFGWSFRLLRPWWWHGLLAVGAPGAQIGGRSYGALYWWETDRAGRPIPGKAARVMGEAVNGQFGKTLEAIAGDTLAVASPTEPWGFPLAGCVRLFSGSKANDLHSLPLLCGKGEGDFLGTSLTPSLWFGAPGHGRIYGWHEGEWKCFIPAGDQTGFGRVLVEDGGFLIVAAAEADGLAKQSGIVYIYQR